jgi:hypothetical protein
MSVSRSRVGGDRFDEDCAMLSRVARFLREKTHQNGKNIPNNHKIFQMATIFSGNM